MSVFIEIVFFFWMGWTALGIYCVDEEIRNIRKILEKQ